MVFVRFLRCICGYNIYKSLGLKATDITELLIFYPQPVEGCVYKFKIAINCLSYAQSLKIIQLIIKKKFELTVKLIRIY